MTLNRVLTLAGIFALVAILFFLLSPQRQWKQPRVYMDDETIASASGQTKEKASTSFDREAFRKLCPHMALLSVSGSADYTMTFFGSASKGWFAYVTRSDGADIYEGQYQDPHAILKQSCAAIRADVEDWTGFGSFSSKTNKTKPVPVGRYAISYHPANPNFAFLLDTKTGAVWELTHHSMELTDRMGTGKKFRVTWRSFERVAVQGLYTSSDESVEEYQAVEESGDSEDKKKERHKRDEEREESERKQEAAKDEQ